jgi:hypothetical protein
MFCKADLLNLPIHEAAAAVNELLVNAALTEPGNAERVTMYVRDYAELATTLYKLPNNTYGNCSILNFLRQNNIQAAVGREVTFKSAFDAPRLPVDCCLRDHANAKPPWTCQCPCHQNLAPTGIPAHDSMSREESLEMLRKLANSTGDQTVPTEDVIDIAQAVLKLLGEDR